MFFSIEKTSFGHISILTIFLPMFLYDNHGHFFNELLYMPKQACIRHLYKENHGHFINELLNKPKPGFYDSNHLLTISSN